MSVPGDPGEPALGRPVRLAILSAVLCAAGAIAVSGLPGPGQVSTRGPAGAALTTGTRADVVPGLGPTAPAPRRASPARPAVPIPRPAPVRPAAQRWLPSGTGMWVHEWTKTMGGDARALVRRAQAHGLSTIYLRTGTRRGGFDGTPQLRALLTATRGTPISVVAWDFPMLIDPAGDARRLALAARYRPPGAHPTRVRAVAPDIETRAEGSRSTASRVRVYLQTLRRLLPADVAILSTVPWPSEQRRGRFPYATVAAGSDALMPMAYWYNRDPATVTTYSIRWLRRYHRPVLPVGQGYDSRLDAPYLPPSNQPREIAGFLRAARANKVQAVSLWSWQTAGPAQWRALAAYRSVFHAPRRSPAHAPRPAPASPAPPFGVLPRSPRQPLV